MLSTHSPKHTQPRAVLIRVVHFFILSPKHKHSRLKYIVVSACCITELKLFVNFEHNRCFLHLHKLPAFEKNHSVCIWCFKTASLQIFTLCYKYLKLTLSPKLADTVPSLHCPKFALALFT